LGLDQLIQKCKENDIKAQEELYRLFSSKLFSICLKYSRNYEEAQDNLQEGFLLIFEKIHQFSFKGSFEGWLKRLVINYILQQYRTESFLNIVTDNLEDVHVEVDIEIEEVSIEYLLKIIQDLPDKYRLVFNLYAIDGYSHQEIADMLNINIGTSKSNLSRARMILKEKLELNNGKNNIPFVK
jgi:RNA polymerase sigma factor (sigma-70 family)